MKSVKRTVFDNPLSKMIVDVSSNIKSDDVYYAVIDSCVVLNDVDSWLNTNIRNRAQDFDET